MGGAVSIDTLTMIYTVIVGDIFVRLALFTTFAGSISNIHALTAFPFTMSHSPQPAQMKEYPWEIVLR